MNVLKKRGATLFLVALTIGIVQWPAAAAEQSLVKNTATKTPTVAVASAAITSTVAPTVGPTVAKGGIYMSAGNSEIYRRIFVLQTLGKIKEADAEMQKLTDFRLRGHVLYQRYMHPTAYKSSYEELHDWMYLYDDHPGAKDIYKLALQKRPKGEKKENLTKPKTVSAYSAPAARTAVYVGKAYQSSTAYTPSERAIVSTLTDVIEAKLKARDYNAALNALQNGDAQKWIDPISMDILRAEVAAGMFYQGKLSNALKLAVQSADRAKSRAPLAGWIAGLIYWQQKQYTKAAHYFEIAGDSSYASGWQASAGAYWAARAHLRNKNSAAMKTWLGKAAKHPRTFYGLMAVRLLGKDFPFNWEKPEFTRAQEDMLFRTRAGQKAFALVAAGQYELAETELLHLDYSNNPQLKDAALAYAAHVDLPGLAMSLGAEEGGKPYDFALYPVVPWEPRGGYQIDPALINAIIRQESKFDPLAKSYMGAAGLMQIMPATAGHVMNNAGFARGQAGFAKLTIPEVNLTLGQNYIQELLQEKVVNGDVIMMLAAYNAGPGNLAQWKQKRKNIKDPLLFVESIPVDETRNYVKYVLSNYWIYRLQAGEDIDTLEALATGKNAKYAFAAPDTTSYALAKNENPARHLAIR